MTYFGIGVSPWSLDLIFSYLSYGTQRVKIKTSYSNKSNIEYGVIQGSILGPLLINIDLIDLLFKFDDFEIADDTAPYSCADDIPSIIRQLQLRASKLFSWFTSNHMEVNPSKCHILLITKIAIDVYFEWYVLRLPRVESFLELQ